MDNIEIGKKIKCLRIEQELTLDDIANKIGVAKSTVQRYENGKINKIKIPVLQSIAEVLKVNPVWLMGYDVPMERMTSQIDTSVISSEFLLKDETVALLNDDSLQPVFEVLKNTDLKPQLVTYANFLLSGYEEKGRD